MRGVVVTGRGQVSAVERGEVEDRRRPRPRAAVDADTDHGATTGRPSRPPRGERGIGVPCDDVGSCPRRAADPRRRRVLRRPDRRPGHGEHRPDLPRRRRPLAPRGRAATATSPWRPTGSRCSSAAPTGRAPPSCRRCARPTLPTWGWTLPVGGGTYHALFPRAWQAFEPETLGVRLVGEQLSPVIGRRPRAERPARRGVRVVGGEPRARPVDGRAPVHLGRPVRGDRPGRAASPPGRRRRTERSRVEFGDAADDAPTALRGHAVDRGAGRRRRGAERARDVRSGRRPGALVGLRRRRAAGARGRAIGGRSARGSGVGRGGRGDVRAGSRRAPLGALRDRLGPAGRRVRRRPALVEALHEGLGPERHRARWTWRGTPWPRRRPGGGRSRRGRRPTSTTRPAPTGTRWRCSTSCTSSWTAARSGSTARSAARCPSPTTSAGSRCSSAWTTRSTTRSTWTSTPRSPCSRSSPSWSSAGSATCWRRSRSTLPEIVRIEASGASAPRKVGGTVPHDVGGPQDDPFIRPNWYTFQEVNELEGPGPQVRAPGVPRRDHGGARGGSTP